VVFDEVWPDDSLSNGSAETASFHDDGAAILMHCPSSGTTGGPKFVPVSHALAMRRVDPDAFGPNAAAAPGSAGLRQACFITESSSYGFSSVLFVLSCGGTVLQPMPDARKVPEWLVRSRVGHMVASPIALQRMAEAMPPLRTPNFLATIEAGGGTLVPSVARLVSDRMCANVFINYGSTECGRVAGGLVSAMLGKAGAVGYAYPGVQIQVVDDDGKPLPAGGEGILRIRSERNANGYLDSARASAVTFRAGWVYPGDRGLLEADGLLRIAGRVDDVINIGGGKVNPETIENAMMAMGGVREVAVFGAAADGGVTVICAAIVPTAPLDADTYHQSCRERLGALAPALIVHMRALPRNSNGKVLRDKLAMIAVEANRRRNPSG
jgi:acyl-coenzyme A synthetase/AMP-(fatty) acid ligase